MPELAAMRHVTPSTQMQSVWLVLLMLVMVVTRLAVPLLEIATAFVWIRFESEWNRKKIIFKKENEELKQRIEALEGK